jgi:ectoine hydroxylase-related dioxygenase (phytanoyl-CoA dioxygenase family)
MSAEKAASEQPKPFIESQDFFEEPKVLSERLKEDGYLFFRDLLDTEPLLDLRKQVLEICDEHGWLVEGSELVEGKGRQDSYSGPFEPTGVYRDIQKLEDFHRLAHLSTIRDLLASILGAKVLPHPRNILRVTLPGGSQAPTPPHQDYPLIQATTNFYTVWFPLSDCPIPLGGLGVARGSNRLGRIPLRPAEGTGGVAVDLDQSTELEWHASDFRLGDMLVINALTVHRAFNNTTKDLLRLSCDYRYQPLGEPITWDSLHPHARTIDWGEIYAGWEGDTYKYYWEGYELQVQPSVPPLEFTGQGTRFHT